MIGKLKGMIDSYGEDFIILDVNGVGYLVHCSARTLQELPGTGQPATLAIETHVREDQIRLFGFLTDVERVVTELKDKAPAYADLDPAVIRLSGAVEDKRAPQPVADAVSALVNLGYGQPQAAAAIAAAAREAGEGAATAQLIRLGLKELAK